MFSNSLNFNPSPDLECQFFDFLGKKVAYFVVNGRRMVCLLQIYELFLKQLVGGLHTVYNKLKRLNILCTVCTIDQVRALRVVGAIQNGVNRCKLIEMSDLEKLIEDCSDLRPRPGRPPRRTLCGLVATKPDATMTDVVPVVGLANSGRPSGASALDGTVSNPLHFLTNFLPITSSALTPEVLATVMQQQFSTLPICSSEPQLMNTMNEDSNNENCEEKQEPEFDNRTAKNLVCFRSDNSSNNSPTENSCDKNGSGKSSFGNNSETDDSFDREKSMSTSDQDSGSNSGPSSSQGDVSPNNQSMQFLLNKLICLIETTESAFKSHCQRLTDLSCELHKQINEIVHRERSSQLSLYFQRQKTAHYRQRYISRKFAPYRHKKRHKSSSSQHNEWNPCDQS